MFATRPIARGSLIVAEHPAYILPGYAIGNITFEDYEEVGRGIPETLYTEVTKMANCWPRETCPSIIDGVARTNALAVQMEFPSNFPDGSTTTKHYGGLFLTIGRCNHSCGQNAAWRWDNQSLSATVFALRDIEEGEEININYTHPLQSREKRWKKLQGDYRFDCDCPWCSHATEGAQARSDRDREYLKVYLATHPTYAKWSTDLCLPDNHVIQSHLAALPLIRKEGLDFLLIVFMEDIVRCYIDLGNESEFRKWAEESVILCRVGNPKLAQELEHILKNPPENASNWGRRKRLKDAQLTRKDNFDMHADDSLFNLFGPSPPTQLAEN